MLYSTGISLREISCRLRRHHATIRREIRRNAPHGYTEYEAEEKAHPKA